MSLWCGQNLMIVYIDREGWRYWMGLGIEVAGSALYVLTIILKTDLRFTLFCLCLEVVMCEVHFARLCWSPCPYSLTLRWLVNCTSAGGTTSPPPVQTHFNPLLTCSFLLPLDIVTAHSPDDFPSPRHPHGRHVFSCRVLGASDDEHCRWRWELA
jgi:hypothetical protein